MKNNKKIKIGIKKVENLQETIKHDLSGGGEDISEVDARIYHYYIKNEHNKFVKIAEDYDKEYQNQV